MLSLIFKKKTIPSLQGGVPAVILLHGTKRLPLLEISCLHYCRFQMPHCLIRIDNDKIMSIRGSIQLLPKQSQSQIQSQSMSLFFVLSCPAAGGASPIECCVYFSRLGARDMFYLKTYFKKKLIIRSYQWKIFKNYCLVFSMNDKEKR